MEMNPTQENLEQSQAYEFAMLLKNIIGLKDASNEEFFKAVEAKDNFLAENGDFVEKNPKFKLKLV